MPNIGSLSRLHIWASLVILGWCYCSMFVFVSFPLLETSGNPAKSIIKDVADE